MSSKLQTLKQVCVRHVVHTQKLLVRMHVMGTLKNDFDSTQLLMGCIFLVVKGLKQKGKFKAKKNLTAGV